MRCPVCNKKNGKDSSFCVFCGAKMESVGTESKQHNNTKALPIIIVGVVIIVLLLGSFVFMAPMLLVERNISAGNYEKAAKICGQIENNSVATNFVVRLLQHDIKIIQDGYKKETCSYTDAVDELSAIGTLNLSRLDIALNNARDYIEDLHTSRGAFVEGKNALESDDFKTAAEQFSLVIVNDFNYEEAQSLLTDTLEQYEESVVENVAELSEKNEYEAALILLDDARTLLPDSEDLDDAENSLNSAYIEYTISLIDTDIENCDFDHAYVLLNTIERLFPDYDEIDIKRSETEKADAEYQFRTFVENGQYEDAILLFNEDEAMFNDDADIVLLLSECEAAYMASVDAEAEEVYQDTGANDACLVIKHALTILPNNEHLEELFVTYEKRIPVSLLDMETLQDYGCGSAIGSPEYNSVDNYGNVYDTSYSVFFETGKGSYCVWNLDGNYTTLDGLLALFEDDKNNAVECWISVYGDDTLLFTSNPISSGIEPVDFQVDISGVKLLKVYFICDSDWLGRRNIVNLYVWNEGTNTV